MSATLSTNGQALRVAFQAWHAEQDTIDAQLNESLAALAAYQSHLDEWQRQLAHDRETLRADQENIESKAASLQAACDQLEREREDLLAGRENSETNSANLQAIRNQLEHEQEVLRAAQRNIENDTAVLRAARDQFERELEELREARENAESAASNIQATRVQVEREREELRVTKERMEADWNELRTARGKIEQERDELRGERSQLERDRAATEKGQFEASATLSADLNAARDKIGALTTSLLSRTEELRTLDNRRAEVVTELELARARERELKAALDEQKRSADEERAHWKEELRHLRELLERRVETPVIEELIPPTIESPAAVVTPQTTLPSHTPLSSGGSVHVTPRENPVLDSIVQQFDKLRQQRASDRNFVNRTK